MQKKILLVDDEELILRAVGKLLQKQGYGVVTASNGADALKIIQTEPIDLIVLDIRMPQMNGVETIKAIRQHQKTKGAKSIPEILITGYADETTLHEAEAVGVADCLYKPFDIRDFLACIKKHLP